VVVDDAALALGAIEEVGPYGHFFGANHTKERYRDAFYAPLLSDWRNYESWHEAGAVWTHQRANAKFKAVLAEYKAPPLDVAAHYALKDFVEQRRADRLLTGWQICPVVMLLAIGTSIKGALEHIGIDVATRGNGDNHTGIGRILPVQCRGDSDGTARLDNDF